MPCHYMFRKCDSLFGPTSYGVVYEPPAGLSQKYILPSEYLTADPPLIPDVAHWLSGKREKRNAFVRRYQEVGCRFYREQRCKASLLGYEKKVITGDILAGERLTPLHARDNH
jgi:hypothetical protein